MKPCALVAIAVLLLGGCKDFPGADGRYARPSRGGWDNFRAEAPVDQNETPGRPSTGPGTADASGSLPKGS